MDWLQLGTAFSLGFLGGAHCIGMCGGLMSALSFAIPERQATRRLLILLTYNLGRILSYAAIGALFGWLGYLSGDHPALRIIAGLLLVAMGLYLANWWHGLRVLEKLGAKAWRFIQPLGKNLMPVRHPGQALLLGAIWGWLPCGLVYSALALASTQADTVQSAATMLFFGLGTLPAVLAGGLLAERVKQLVQNRGLRIVFALAIIAFGLWTIYMGLPQSEGHHHHH